jgi:hypothetical protein
LQPSWSREDKGKKVRKREGEERSKEEKERGEGRGKRESLLYLCIFLQRSKRRPELFSPLPQNPWHNYISGCLFYHPRSTPYLEFLRIHGYTRSNLEKN